MRDLAMRALDTAKTRGADYADVRIVRFKSENVTVRNKNVEALTSDESLGFGVRVIVDGYWGFASQPQDDAGRGRRASRREAVRIAKASALRARASAPTSGRRSRSAAPIARRCRRTRSPSRSTTRSRCCSAPTRR